LLISSVVRDACHFGVAAVKETPTTALDTRVVLSAMPAYADPLSLLPSSHPGSHFIDDAGNFVPRNPRILNSRPQAFFHKHVAVADATGQNFDPNSSGRRLRHRSLDNLKLSFRRRYLGNVHCFHDFDVTVCAD